MTPPPIMLIGEAWGRQEELAGHEFVGATGRLLAKMLSNTKLAPKLQNENPTHRDLIAHWHHLRTEHNIHTNNVFQQRPENNRIELFFGKTSNPTLPPLRPGKYILPTHMPSILRLWDDISTIKPHLILALGNTALWATAQITGISTYRGAVTWMPQLKFKILPTYHPAAIMRQWPLHTIGLRDFEKAKVEAEFPEIRRTERWITTLPPTSAGLLNGWDWFQRPATKYTNDIETAIGQISMLSFARSKEDALVIQFHDQDESGKLCNFWPEPWMEVEAWKLAIHGLKTSIPKTFQNGIYDLSYYAHMGIIPSHCTGDTMLKSHARFPEHPKALGFLGSVYANELAWKPMRTHGNKILKRDE
jgi:uracil-DNA glycosylase